MITNLPTSIIVDTWTPDQIQITYPIILIFFNDQEIGNSEWTFDHGSHHKIENNFLNMDFYHKINPIIIWSHFSDWLIMITFITKHSSPPPPPCFLFSSHHDMVQTNILGKQWYHNTSLSSRWRWTITNRRISWRKNDITIHLGLGGGNEQSPTEEGEFASVSPGDCVSSKLEIFLQKFLNKYQMFKDQFWPFPLEQA